jgi:hypothetical protein
MPYEYRAKVTEVVDENTIIINIDLGFSVKLTYQKKSLVTPSNK